MMFMRVEEGNWGKDTLKALPVEQKTGQKERLRKMTPQIVETAWELGFRPPETTFEIVPTDVIDTIAAYNLPGTYNYWAWGEDYWKQKEEREKGARIYELVVNTRPYKGYLAGNNSDISQILVIAHVLGHTDFFEHNIAFKNTDPYIAENVLAHAERVDLYEKKYGLITVEQFLDAAHSLMWNIDPDPSSFLNSMSPKEYLAFGRERFLANWKRQNTSRNFGYEDLWGLEAKNKEKPKEPKVPFPPFEERNLLRFIRMFAPQGFDAWQDDTLDIVEKKAAHLWGNIETKIMNEGWASFAHLHIMRALAEKRLIPAESDDLIEWALLHAGVIQRNPHYPNPYQLGLAIWEDIDRKHKGLARWDGKLDYDWMGNVIDVTKMSFEERDRRYNPRMIMESHRDESFLREFLTPALIEDLELYQYALKKGDKPYDSDEHWRITTREAEEIRDGLVASKVNNGFPMIVIPPGGGDYQGNRELYLLHKHEGQEDSDLDFKDTTGTLTYLYKLWGRTVHLETVVKGKTVLFSCSDGTSIQTKQL